MAYSDFSLAKVKKDFELVEQTGHLFQQVGTLEASPWLKETFAVSIPLALSSSSEKARSEFIVAPILLEIEKRNPGEFAIFSGERLDVDEEKGLKGECDFILSKGPISSNVQAPILLLVEAKKNDIKEGLGQCIAQMIGAQLFNRKENNQIEEIHGCVTTGEAWQFLKLTGKTILISAPRYYLGELQQVLWLFQHIVDIYKTKPG
ncbi:Type I restriction enzyme R protein N terminal domain protein [Gammaproteobacteria bacterium]